MSNSFAFSHSLMEFDDSAAALFPSISTHIPTESAFVVVDQNEVSEHQNIQPLHLNQQHIQIALNQTQKIEGTHSQHRFLNQPQIIIHQTPIQQQPIQPQQPIQQQQQIQQQPQSQQQQQIQPQSQQQQQIQPQMQQPQMQQPQQQPHQQQQQPHQQQQQQQQQPQPQLKPIVEQIINEGPNSHRYDDENESYVVLVNRYPVFSLHWNGEYSHQNLALKCILAKTSVPQYRDSRGSPPMDLSCTIPIRIACQLLKESPVESSPIPKLAQRWSFNPWREVKDRIAAEMAKGLPFTLQKRNINALRFEVVDLENDQSLSRSEIIYRSGSPTQIPDIAFSAKMHQNVHASQNLILSMKTSMNAIPQQQSGLAGAQTPSLVNSPTSITDSPPLDEREKTAQFGKRKRSAAEIDNTDSYPAPLCKVGATGISFCDSRKSSFEIGGRPIQQIQQQQPQFTVQMGPIPALQYAHSMMVSTQQHQTQQIMTQDPSELLNRIAQQLSKCPRDKLQIAAPQICKVMSDLLNVISAQTS